EEIKLAVRKAVLSGKFYVVSGGDGRGVIVEKLLDAAVDFLPSPLDVPAIEGEDPKTGDEMTRKVSDEEPFAALAFKVATDPYVGKLTFFRVYSGVVEAGSYVLNSNTGNKERLGRIVRLHSNTREDVDKVFAGDIAAAVGLKGTTTGDTLCDEKSPIMLENIVFPEPPMAVAIEPKTKADQEKMSMALQRLSEEDPTFRVTTNDETGQTIVAGMGELHLDIIVDRMKREFKVEADVGKPQVAYREAITKAATNVEAKFIRQTGGRGQYGHVIIDVEPRERGEGFAFENAIVGGTIPKEYIKPVEEGIKEALASGIIAGYPVVDVGVKLHDGSYHDVDSSEVAFKIAGSMAIQDGVKRAGPVLLEPVMQVEVITPEEFMGDVMGDINSRRGRVEKMEDRAKSKIIDAFVPLAEMFGYTTDIRSMTQGRAVSSMELARYEEVPKNIAEELIGSSE
ncbi:MAG: elongation factor G, partial [Candidatus Saccharimonadales bacterium]